jgi:hypothetical protein
MQSVPRAVAGGSIDWSASVLACMSLVRATLQPGRLRSSQVDPYELNSLSTRMQTSKEDANLLTQTNDLIIIKFNAQLFKRER